MADRAQDYLDAVKLLFPAAGEALEILTDRVAEAQGAIWPIARGEIVYVERASEWHVRHSWESDSHLVFGSWQDAYAAWRTKKAAPVPRPERGSE